MYTHDTLCVLQLKMVLRYSSSRQLGGYYVLDFLPRRVGVSRVSNDRLDIHPDVRTFLTGSAVRITLTGYGDDIEQYQIFDISAHGWYVNLDNGDLLNLYTCRPVVYYNIRRYIQIWIQHIVPLSGNIHAHIYMLMFFF